MSAEQLLNRPTNIKDMAPLLEKNSHRPDVLFYPKTDITPSDWSHILSDVPWKDQGSSILGERSTYQTRALMLAKIKIIDPEEAILPDEVLWDILQFQTPDTLSDDLIKTHRSLLFKSAMRTIFPDRFAEERIGEETSWISFVSAIDKSHYLILGWNIVKGTKNYVHSNIYVDQLWEKIKVNGGYSLQDAAALKVFTPEELNILIKKEFSPTGIQLFLDSQRDSNDWEGFLNTAYYLSIISCESTEIDDRGLTLTWPKIEKAYETPVPLPNERKF